MKRLNLDRATPSVKKFVRGLRPDSEGIMLELNGQVLCKVIPATQFSEAEKMALLERGRELIRQARERNRGVPTRVIEREVRDAVRMVRSRK